MKSLLLFSLVLMSLNVAVAANPELKVVYKGCKSAERLNRDDCFRSGLKTIHDKTENADEKKLLATVINGCEYSGNFKSEGKCYKKATKDLIRGKKIKSLIRRMCEKGDRMNKDDCYFAALRTYGGFELTINTCEAAGNFKQEAKCYKRALR